MTDAGVAVGLDRLPWLSDEPGREAPPAGRRELLPWAVAAVVLVAGVSYWMGAKSVEDQGFGEPRRWSGTVVQLPEPAPAPAQPEVRPAPMPEVRPAPAPLVDMPPIERPQPARKQAAQESNPVRKTTAPKAERNRRAAPAEPSAPAATAGAGRLWPSGEVRGASGRLVQIGAFGSRQQAKLGWRRMTRFYPAVGGLPTLVVPARNSRGRLFYRLQIGTTSQAHSEVLCQRMRTISMSCAVVGLPWKAKVER